MPGQRRRLVLLPETHTACSLTLAVITRVIAASGLHITPAGDQNFDHLIYVKFPSPVAPAIRSGLDKACPS